MPRGRPIEPVVLTDDEKDQLPQPRQLSLLASWSGDGVRKSFSPAPRARRTPRSPGACRLSDATVGKWRKRYRMQGIEGLHDELRAGRPRTHDDERVAEVINTALQTKPPDGATHWSCARHGSSKASVSKSTVQRWFSLFAIQPHRQRYFKLVQRPLLRRDWCAISSASISTRPTTPSCCVSTRKPRSRRSTAPNRCCRCRLGYVEGVTHDYVRHGTTTLFAALDIATGQVITQCKKRHRHQEFLAFLRHIDANVPEPFDRITSSPTTTPPTSTRRSELGSQGDRDTTSTTHPPMPRGSTRSSAGSASSLKRPFDAARSPTSANW